ncbi:MAG: hypothetical protein PHU88_06260 [candidate division Zixibacteria bacterium]|nr:hypothetical protein [candidate division Zixibacteria bacterium]
MQTVKEELIWLREWRDPFELSTKVGRWIESKSRAEPFSSSAYFIKWAANVHICPRFVVGVRPRAPTIFITDFFHHLAHGDVCQAQNNKTNPFSYNSNEFF